MKFLIVTRYGNTIVEAEDFEEAAREAEMHEGMMRNDNNKH